MLAERPATPDAIFAEAMVHHAAGRLDAARDLYHRVFAEDECHADSLHLLGLATAQGGAPEPAIPLIRRAMSLNPRQAPYHNSLAYALRQTGRFAEAVREYRLAVALRPMSAELHNNLATALTEVGCADEALAHYRKAAEFAPGVAAVWYNLANALADTGDITDTEACFRRAIALAPGYADALGNYGRWLMTRGRTADAVAPLTDATRLAPDRPAAWSNLAYTLAALGHLEAAETSCRTALAADTRFAAAHHNLGCILFSQGRTDEAIGSQAAAIAADPTLSAARLALCMAQLPIVYGSAAEVPRRRQRYAAALADLTAATQNPDVARSLAAAIGTSQPFYLPYQGQDDRGLQAQYGQLACSVLRQAFPPAVLAEPPRATDRIRLGIVSGFFCDHTLFRLFLEGWLSRIDRSRFELVAFHTGTAWDDRTARAAVWCDRFVHGLPSPAAWRQCVENAAPHVLLYPEVGMDPIAAWLAAQRLAPVQCVAWGQPETTGLPTIDHFLSSDLMEPPDSNALYTEQLVRLPNLGLWYRPDELTSVRVSRSELGLRPDATVFWSGQAIYKYHPQFDTIYPRIAAAAGDCQFVFIAFARSAATTDILRRRLAAAFAMADLDADQDRVFLPPMSQDRFVAAVGLADVVLDTPGWSGGKSTLDCLAQDPAIVTWPGPFMRGRHTAAILRRIGCDATIVGSADEYVAIAARLARDPAWRAEVRRQVQAGKHRAFADEAYIESLQAFIEGVVRRA